MKRGTRRRSSLWTAFVLTAVVMSGCGSDDGDTKSRSTTTHRPTTTTEAPTTTTLPALPTPYLPLFPFQNPAEVQEWQAAYRTDGQEPWHLDAGETSLAFARFLGYPEVDRVVEARADEDGAHVTIGGLIPDTDRTTDAAVVHLVRFGSATDAPWEVVGTDDTTFSLTIPAYGATVSSPLRVGGRITGIDDNIRVQVRQLHDGRLLGEMCCLPAGGENTPWSTTLTFEAPNDPVVTVSVATGGHVLQVERFAVTGARVAG